MIGAGYVVRSILYTILPKQIQINALRVGLFLNHCIKLVS